MIARFFQARSGAFLSISKIGRLPTLAKPNLLAKCVALISLAIFLPTRAAADFGLGVILGSPTGISFKYETARDHAVDAALAWDLGDEHVHLHSDYLWLRNSAIHMKPHALDWYFGVGGRVVIVHHKIPHDHHDDDYWIGVRGPIGIGYTFKDPKIELFAEVALIMNLLQSTSVDLDAGIGARFHF